MADPQAVNRMAMQGGGMPQGPHKMPGGEMMGGDGPGPGAPDPSGGGGLETMVKNLDDVGQFLQSKGPQAQAAMAAFQTLLRELGQLGGEETPEGAPGEPSPAGPPGAVHESRRPGVQVL